MNLIQFQVSTKFESYQAGKDTLTAQLLLFADPLLPVLALLQAEHKVMWICGGSSLLTLATKLEMLVLQIAVFGISARSTN